MNLSKEIENQLNELSGIDQRIIIESQIITRSQLLIAITLDKSLINSNSFEPLDIIRFVLLIKPTYPNTPPQLYCISRFCVPELCDGRDFLEDTLQMKWDSKNCFLKLIISQIPSFIQRYLNTILNYKNKSEIILKREMFGKYYLDSIYELSLIKYIPYLYFDVISEIISIKGNTMNIEDRKILITDNFLLLFCNKSLYELDQLKLVFVGPITSLVYIRQFIKDGIVLLKWLVKGKGPGKNNYYVMQLRTPDGDYIVDTLIENLSKRSINFKVTNKINGNIKREGSVPLIEINLVEEEIKNLEKKISSKEDVTKESISVLINLYEKAIQYYSALNDKRFEIYIKKTHEIYSNNEYTSLLNMKTISTANNQYNVTQFKRKRKKRAGEEGEGKKKREKKTKKKGDKKAKNEEKDKKNIDKKEDKKEENINNINNENEQYSNENKNEINEENKNELNDKEKNDNNGNINNDNNDENNIINEKEEKKEENKKENKKEKKQPNRPKRNLKKREEGGSRTYRKNRTETNDNNLIENAKSERMLIDKKEIEEMIKNELNMSLANTNKENEIKNDNTDDNKDKGNIEKEENKKEEPNGQ